MVQKLAYKFFYLVSKNKMAATAVSFKFLGTLLPRISKGMQCTLSKFAGYVRHGQSFLGNYSGYLDKNKMAAVGASLTVFFYKIQKVQISRKP